jgi:hypothetical protein
VVATSRARITVISAIAMADPMRPVRQNYYAL